MAEAKYSGVKYEPKRVQVVSSPSRHLVNEMILWGRIFDALKLAPPYENGSYGNMGFRDVDGSIRVTPSSRSIGDLFSDEIMTITGVEERKKQKPLVYFYGNLERTPTSEAQIYWDLFQKIPWVNVILHGHDVFSTKHADFLAKKFKEVSVTRRCRDYGTKEFKDEVLSALTKDTSYLVAKKHGFFSFGKTFEEAGVRAIKFHTIAREYESRANK